MKNEKNNLTSDDRAGVDVLHSHSPKLMEHNPYRALGLWALLDSSN
jgi:hypothetical protein